MRTKLVALLLVALIAVASFSMRPVSAQTEAPTDAPETCADAALLKEIGEDLTTIGKSLTEIPKLEAAGLYNVMIDISNTRHKYEDKALPATNGCIYMQTETIILLATIQDYAVVELADKLALDKEMIGKNREFMNKRLETQLKAVTDLLPKAS
jgi:hypothetical protein